MRSVLFAGATRPDLVAKLPRSGPDAVVVDLEDAVPPSHKAEARAAARELAGGLASEHPSLDVFVRVNAVASPWIAADVAEALAANLAGVVVPKVESAADVDRARQLLAGAGRDGLAVFAGIESALGVVRAGEILGSGVAFAYFGAEDYIADLGGRRTARGDEVLYARSKVALHARVHGVPCIDIVTADVRDPEAFRADAERGRDLGYHGKLCLHPAQVAIANEVFGATGEEVDRARRMLAAAEAAAAEGRGAIAFEGAMVDEPALRMARAVLDRAARR